MALMTGEQYLDSMRKLNMQIYMFGEKSKILLIIQFSDHL